MAPSNSVLLAGRLEDLRDELAELAFGLERQGKLDAADIAMATRARLAELCEELLPVNTPSDRGQALRSSEIAVPPAAGGALLSARAFCL